MAKAVKVLCDRCESKITAGISFCGNCDYPTQWASLEERTAWEVSQWKTADRSHAPGSLSQSGRASRRWLPRPFGRKTEPKPAPELASKNERPIEAGNAPPAAPVSSAASPTATVAVAPAPEPEMVAAPAPAPRVERTPARVKPVARTPAARPTTTILPGPRDDEALRDSPATVMAMRLLNARVAELDAKVRRLERELNQAPPAIDLP